MIEENNYIFEVHTLCDERDAKIGQLVDKKLRQCLPGILLEIKDELKIELNHKYAVKLLKAHVYDKSIKSACSK